MVLLYKDPDGTDLFAVHGEPQFTPELSRYTEQQDGIDVDGLKHRIRQLENELTKYEEVCFIAIQ